MNGFYPEGEFVGALGSYPVMNNLENLIPNSSLCADTVIASSNSIVGLQTKTTINSNNIVYLQATSNLIGSETSNTNISNINTNGEIRFLNKITGTANYTTKIDSNGEIFYYHKLNTITYPLKAEGWYNIHTGIAQAEMDIKGLQFSTANNEAAIGLLQTATAPFSSATIASIATSAGTGAAALGLATVAYNQVQTKNPIITWNAPLLYNTQTNTASFNPNFKLITSYSSPLNSNISTCNLSIDNIEVVSTIATLNKNGSTVQPTLVSGSTYQYIYDQSGTITFNVDTPITRDDTAVNSVITTTTSTLLANTPLTITIPPLSYYISTFNFISGGLYDSTPIVNFSGGGTGSTQAVGAALFAPSPLGYIHLYAPTPIYNDGALPYFTL